MKYQKMTKWDNPKVDIIDCLKEFKTQHENKLQQPATWIVSPGELDFLILKFTNILNLSTLSDSHKKAIQSQINYLKKLQLNND